MSFDTSDPVAGAQKIDPNQPVVGGGTEEQGPKEDFSSYMNRPDQAQAPGQAGGPEGAVSPMELAKGNTLPSQANMETVASQIQGTDKTLNKVHDQLETTNLKLKPSQRQLLKGKLTNASNYIQGAADQVGVKAPHHPTKISRSNPVAKFLGMVTDAQQQMKDTQEEVKKISASGKVMNPGRMLLMQTKLARAQQELEYSSIVLSKAVDDVKQLFNVQI